LKLLVAVIQTEDASLLTDALVKNDVRVTRIDTAGGFLRRGNTTILVGVDDHRVEDVLRLIRSNCQTRLEYMTPSLVGAEIGELAALTPIEVQVGGATVWIADVDDFVRL
jgi:uncharacterized protein YaaQ